MFQIFLDGIRKAGHSLFIPQIVLDETVNKFRDSLIETMQEWERLSERIRRLASNKPSSVFDENSIDELVANYRRNLTRKLKEPVSPNFRTISYPDVPHSRLVAKALQRKKPFSLSGRGYRDALIWENILWLEETYSGSERTAFITANIKDFADDKFALHPDLLTDLDERKLAPGSIILYPNLKAFVTEQILAQFENLQGLQDRLNQDECEGLDFKERVRLILAEELHYRELNEVKGVIPSECEKPLITHVLSIEKYNVTDARKYNAMTDSRILLSVDLTALCEIESRLHHSNWPLIQKERHTIIASVEKLDASYLKVILHVNISFSINLFFDEPTNEFWLDDADISMLDTKV